MHAKAIKWVGLALVSTLVLAGCKHEGSSIQRSYAADRTDCREYAEHTVGGRGNASSAGDPHLHLVNAFARCMHNRGWAVNKPPEQPQRGR